MCRWINIRVMKKEQRRCEDRELRKRREWNNGEFLKLWKNIEVIKGDERIGSVGEGREGKNVNSTRGWKERMKNVKNESMKRVKRKKRWWEKWRKIKVRMSWIVMKRERMDKEKRERRKENEKWWDREREDYEEIEEMREKDPRY